jgi:hypothetical protein
MSTPILVRTTIVYEYIERRCSQQRSEVYAKAGAIAEELLLISGDSGPYVSLEVEKTEAQ